MKKFIVTAIAVFISLSAFAQYIGGPENLQPIYGTRVLGVKVDFDSVRLIGLPMSDYQEANDDLIRDKQEIYDDFVEDLNDRIRKRKDGLTCTSLGSAPYSIVVIPTSISANGNVVAVIQYLKGEEVIYSYEAFGKGGKIGTFTNLVGDGMDSLAKIISKELKKFAVAKKI